LKVLITGASGHVGHKLLSTAKSRGQDVFATSNQHPTLGGQTTRLDLTNLSPVESLFAKIEPDVVISTAAFTDVDRCEAEFEKAM